MSREGTLAKGCIIKVVIEKRLSPKEIQGPTKMNHQIPISKGDNPDEQY